jgi:polysaccharide biosynthesis transport protein
MIHFRGHLARIWKRVYIVVAVVALAALAASMPNQDTKYTATASLITVSANRAPEQDGILARGYVDLLVEPSFQQELREKAGVPADVTLAARTAAASPIIYVSATSTDRTTAERSAARAAEQFRTQINASLTASRDGSVAEMRQAFEQAAPKGAVREAALVQLQDRIDALNADITNKLQILQLDSDATASTPATVRVVAVAVVGGLLLGCGIALALGFFSRRLTTPYDLREKASIEPLLVIPPVGARDGGTARQAQLRQLAATVALATVPSSTVATRAHSRSRRETTAGSPTVIAVTTVGSTLETGEISRAVATYRADQGVTTVLVHTDTDWPLGNSDLSGQPLAGGLFMITKSVGAGFREVLPARAYSDPHELLGIEHMRTLADSLRAMADLVVIQAPDAKSSDARMVCAVADRTLLVVKEGASANEVVAARNALQESGVHLLGVVFVRLTSRHRWLPTRHIGAKAVPITESNDEPRHQPGSEKWAGAAADEQPPELGRLPTAAGGSLAENTADKPTGGPVVGEPSRVGSHY